MRRLQSTSKTPDPIVLAYDVPCRRELVEIFGASRDFLHSTYGSSSSPFIPGLPIGNAQPPTTDSLTIDSATGRAYVAFRKGETVGYVVDLIGDSTQMLEYTYDGRCIGFAVSNLSAPILIDSLTPFETEVRALIQAQGLQTMDCAMHLERIREGREGVLVSIEGCGGPTVATIDLNGDGSVVLSKGRNDNAQPGLRIIHAERGVNIAGIADDAVRLRVRAILINKGFEVVA